MKQPKPLIVLHPDVGTKPTKQMLRRAGYVVVVGDPEQFKVIDVLPVGAIDLITRSALEAVVGTSYAPARFGKVLAKALLAATADTPVPPAQEDGT